MDRKKKKAAAAAVAPAPAAVDGMSDKERVKFWENFIDYNIVAARDIFLRSLLRDAAAEYKQEAAARRAAAAGEEGEGEEEEDEDRGHRYERFFFGLSSMPRAREASPPPEPMVVLCLRAPAPAQAPHLAVGDLMKREALLREAASEYKQEEAACCAAAAGVKDDDEDQGHPHDRFFSEPSSTPWERETSTPSEPTHNAPMVVLCLPAAQPHLLAAGRPKRAAPSAAISVPQCKKARAAPVPSAATSRRRGASERAR